MSLAICYSRAASGLYAPLVTVETHISYGQVGLHMVGLPEAAVKESKDRVRSALINSHFEFPLRRITINLAPADLPKEGGRFDLPIALGILAASEQIPIEKYQAYEFLGELALSGELRPIRGVIPSILSANTAKRQVIVPHANRTEAGFLKQAETYSATHLLEVCEFLTGNKTLPLCENDFKTVSASSSVDLSDVQGQHHAKKALEIAAAGKHNVLFIGPPGCGKTMLAVRLATILPGLTDEEAIEVAALYSLTTLSFDTKYINQIPFRAPHHTTSSIALVGGGRSPKPGEISLAHRGILFLDELPEFGRHALESLREPLESGQITVSRADYKETFPAAFQLIAAMNPCPCGYLGSQTGRCHCTHEKIQRYFLKISGPLLDRIDLQVEMPSVGHEYLTNARGKPEASHVAKQRVLAARNKQFERQGKYNHFLSVPELLPVCALDQATENALLETIRQLKLSARAYHRILKIARTIADLDGQKRVLKYHVDEALTYRSLDRSKMVSMAY